MDRDDDLAACRLGWAGILLSASSELGYDHSRRAIRRQWCTLQPGQIIATFEDKKCAARASADGAHATLREVCDADNVTI
jgi:hypothetical protein